MGLVDILVSERQPEEIFQHLDRLHRNARKGIFTGSHGQDFRGMIIRAGEESALSLYGADPAILNGWMECRGLTIAQLRNCLENPEKAPPLPEILETEIADIQMLQEVIVREGTIMDVKINSDFGYPDMIFEFSLEGKVYVSLWINIGRSGLNDGNNYIIVNEIQGAKTDESCYVELKRNLGIHPFDLATLSLIQAIKQLRNHKWKIVKAQGVSEEFSRVIAEMYFDKEQSTTNPTKEPLTIKMEAQGTWEGYATLQGPFYDLKKENKAMRRGLRAMARRKDGQIQTY